MGTPLLTSEPTGHVPRRPRARLYPYYILDCSDADWRCDVRSIMDHFESGGYSPDVVVFIPRAGYYLRKLFVEEFGHAYELGFFTVRRASSVRSPSALLRLAFRNRRLANLFRHIEVILRVLKYRLGWHHHRHIEGDLDVDVRGKHALIIDDSVDTGTTVYTVADRLRDAGASEVRIGCISNLLLPREVKVDFAVYEYALVRTPNSRDYCAS